MTYTIEHKGLEIEFSPHGGEPMTRDYPGDPPYIEIDGAIVSDWDEFVAWFGAKGETPMFAPDLESLIEKILNRDAVSIEDSAWDLVNDDEPDCDDGDDYYGDHDIYGGGAYDGGDWGY